MTKIVISKRKLKLKIKEDKIRMIKQNKNLITVELLRPSGKYEIFDMEIFDYFDNWKDSI